MLPNMNTLSQRIVETYAECASTYDEEVVQFPYYRTLKKLVFSFDWAGSVLDLGCGTGLLGQLLNEKGEPCTIVGVDLSPHMTSSPSIRKYYETPIIIGTVQDAIAQSRNVNHVACFGTLTYLNQDEFLAFLERTLVVAQRSITFDMEDVSEEYREKMATDSTILPCYNHTQAWKYWKKSKLPTAWRVVYDEYGLQYHDNHETGCDINDTMIRLERIVA
jgi:predicted TPR repeat methyltransferase